MPFDFTSTIKPFMAASIVESLRASRPASRRPSTAYSQGSRVSNAGNTYIAIAGGTTGPGAGPSNTSGTTLDGTVQWLALGIDTVQDGDINSNLYLGIGAQEEWPNPSTPPAADVNGIGQSEALASATAFIALNADNIRLGIAKNAWVSGTEYSQYDPTLGADEYTTPYYVVVDDTFVYKCLDNNRGAESLDTPVGTSSSIIELADGYIWKFIGTVANKDLFDFGTTSFVPLPADTGVAAVQGQLSTFGPVQTVGSSFGDTDVLTVTVIGSGSGGAGAVRTTVVGAAQTVDSIFASALGSGYDSETFAIVQNEDALGSGATLEATIVSGEVDDIDVITPGSAYVTASVVIIGDGTGALATATVSGGQITTVAITDGGTGYTWARAFVIPGDTGAVAQAVLAPSGGHGFDLQSELTASTVLLSCRLTASLNSYVPTDGGSVDGSFRQVTLVGGVRADTDSTRNAEAYLGPAHPNFDAPGNLDKYLEGSGYVLYINNIVAIVHTATQEEVIKVSISI